MRSGFQPAVLVFAVLTSTAALATAAPPEPTPAGTRTEASIRLLAPDGELMTGLLRFDVEVRGPIDHVVFSFEDRKITRRRPPFQVELDLGPIPRAREISVLGFDAAGRVVARDALVVNGGPHRFAVRFVEPTDGARAVAEVRVKLGVAVPAGATLDRVDLTRDGEPAATMHQAPFEVAVPIGIRQEPVLLRAVARLEDGRETEAVVLLNGTQSHDAIDVELVELYTTVVDGRGRLVTDLAAEDFAVFEDGRPQQLARFERTRRRPVTATVVIDTSASMAPRLETVRHAATGFAEALLAEHEADRVAAMTFNDRPRLAAPLGRATEDFAEGIARARAERGTALYDSVVYALFHNQGLDGHRAILLLSDGVDETSRYDLEDALDYARRAEATIFTIGIDLPNGKTDRRVLTRFAEETGGRSFFLDDVDRLDEVYATILDTLRATYLLAYQRDTSETRGGYRPVEVRMARRGLEARTIRGYYPGPRMP